MFTGGWVWGLTQRKDLPNRSIQRVPGHEVSFWMIQFNGSGKREPRLKDHGFWTVIVGCPRAFLKVFPMKGARIPEFLSRSGRSRTWRQHIYRNFMSFSWPGQFALAASNFCTMSTSKPRCKQESIRNTIRPLMSFVNLKKCHRP